MNRITADVQKRLMQKQEEKRRRQEEEARKKQEAEAFLQRPRKCWSPDGRLITLGSGQGFGLAPWDEERSSMISKNVKRGLQGVRTKRS